MHCRPCILVMQHATPQCAQSEKLPPESHQSYATPQTLTFKRRQDINGVWPSCPPTARYRVLSMVTEYCAHVGPAAKKRLGRRAGGSAALEPLTFDRHPHRIPARACKPVLISKLWKLASLQASNTTFAPLSPVAIYAAAPLVPHRCHTCARASKRQKFSSPLCSGSCKAL